MYKTTLKLKKYCFSSVYTANFFLIILIITSKFISTSSNSYIVNDNTLKSVYNSIEKSKFHELFQLNESHFQKTSFFSTFESKNDRAPPSYSILMNFQNDGTTSVQVFANNVIYWNDKGLCKHGQMFDPSINQCRDVFCVEGFIFTIDGCKPDPTFNKTLSFNINNTSIPDDLELEVTLLNKICIEKNNNCSKILLMDSPEKLIEEIQSAISRDLHINSTRIQNITILYNDTVNTTASSVNQTVFKNETIIIKNTFERVRISFIVKDNKLYPDDNEETLMLYYTLLKLSLDYYEFELFGSKIVICNVTEMKSSQGWCKSPDSHILKVNGFSILASFDNNGKTKYYVYVNETDTIYGTGDFFLSIGYIPKLGSLNFTENAKKNHLGFNLKNLQDVTNVLFGNSEDDLTIQKMLTVCNRYPRISTICPDHETIRLKICELTELRNRTYCYIDSCYSINEYEFDSEQADHIRVCKFDKDKQNGSYDNTKIKIASTLPGYISFVSNIFSLTAMIITLITFALFNELRNIPGWNCINLTMALTIAQFSFLIGSLVIPIPLICFIAALLTHYGFLAAFFWMSVIAFDLYRNFRSKSSHILINTVNLKSRLLKYAGYAWLAPLLIVILCIIIDTTVKSKDFIFKPCYASYFHGCSASHSPLKLLSKTLQYKNITTTDFVHQRNATEKPCVAAGTEATFHTYTHIVQHCWIQNGNANLLFFGAPIGVIILVNAIFYILTIYNIRQKRRNQKHIKIRRFSRVKCPGDDDIKFYIRMAVIMGFTWIIGFFLTTFSSESDEFKIINQILIYAFILSNASMGVFIFFVFIYKKEVKDLYASFLKSKRNDRNNGAICRFLVILKERLISMKNRIRSLCGHNEANSS
jgi:hypothetical protein